MKNNNWTDLPESFGYYWVKKENGTISLKYLEYDEEIKSRCIL